MRKAVIKKPIQTYLCVEILETAGMVVVPSVPAAEPAAEAVLKGGSVTDDFGYTWTLKSPDEKADRYFQLHTRINGQEQLVWAYKRTGWSKDRAAVNKAMIMDTLI